MNNRWTVDLFRNSLEGSSSVLNEPSCLSFSAASQRSPDSFLETRILSHKEIKRSAEKALKRQLERKVKMNKQDQLKLLLATAHDLHLYTKEFIDAVKDGNNRRAMTKMLYVEIELENFRKNEERYKSTDIED